MSPADGLVGVAATGDYRATLEALRNRLAVEVERVADEGFCVECKRGSSSVAPVAARLTEVLELLEKLPKPAKGTPLDELGQRRKAAGRPDASGAAGAEGGSLRR